MQPHLTWRNGLPAWVAAPLQLAVDQRINSPNGPARCGSATSCGLLSAYGTDSLQKQFIRPLCKAAMQGCIERRDCETVQDSCRVSGVRRPASPPLRPASRASVALNWCALPLAWAALPPLLAIWRCRSGSMEAKPRRLVAWRGLRLSVSWVLSGLLDMGFLGSLGKGNSSVQSGQSALPSALKPLKSRKHPMRQGAQH